MFYQERWRRLSIMASWAFGFLFENQVHEEKLVKGYCYELARLTTILGTKIYIFTTYYDRTIRCN